MYWMLLPLRRFADFAGRSRRTEFWMFTLFQIILIAVVMTLASALAIAAMSGLATVLMVAYLLFNIALLIPSLAVQVRRFHDVDMSGWSVLLGLIPFAGPIIVLVCMCKDGTPGDNRFGPDPKERGSVGDVFA